MRLSALIRGHKWQFAVTIGSVLLEAGLVVLFPLFIGYAIDDALEGVYSGALHLGLLGLATLIVGAFRRYFDSRFYAKLYEHLGARVGDREDVVVTTKSAHLGFLTEVVEFFENVLPETINQGIGLVGTLIIVGTLNGTLLVGCLFVLLLTVVVYAFSSKRTMELNAGYNQELERQVEVVSEYQPIALRYHLKKLMGWNIRLSDLETVNFSIVWVLMMGFLVSAIVYAVGQGITTYGAIFALVLYLFQFIEASVVMPQFYQQWLRLKGILTRLESL